MKDSQKALIQTAITVLTAVLTVLLVIPGNQGESVLQYAITALKALVLGG